MREGEEGIQIFFLLGLDEFCREEVSRWIFFKFFNLFIRSSVTREHSDMGPFKCEIIPS